MRYLIIAVGGNPTRYEFETWEAVRDWFEQTNAGKKARATIRGWSLTQELWRAGWLFYKQVDE